MQLRVKDLENQIDKMAKKLNRVSIHDQVGTEIESPFSSHISRFTIPRKFKQPHLETYNGTGSPVDHIWPYKAQMALATNSDKLLCLPFPSTLKGLAA